MEARHWGEEKTAGPPGPHPFSTSDSLLRNTSNTSGERRRTSSSAALYNILGRGLTGVKRAGGRWLSGHRGAYGSGSSQDPPSLMSFAEASLE